MKSKQAILLALFFIIIAGGMFFVANARSQEARSQAEKARAAALHAEQEQRRMNLEQKEQAK